MLLLDVQPPNHSNPDQSEPLITEANLLRASAFTGFNHPLPVSNELIPKVLYSYSNPLSNERRTDIILKDIVVKIYSFREPHVSELQTPSTKFLAIVVSSADRKKQLEIEIETLRPVPAYVFKHNGIPLEGAGYGDLEMALISKLLPERVPADKQNSLPKSLTNLLYSLTK